MRVYTGIYSDEIKRLKEALATCDAVIIGAGSGLSTAAGFTYSGERFQKYFGDFADKYGIMDMYTGGFYQFPTPEIKWAWWSRQVWINRYVPAPKPVYNDLLALVKDKDYFAITTNVDHQFQLAGFDKKRLFYTQGDCGLFQCSVPCHKDTYDNKEVIRKMVEAQGFLIGTDGSLAFPESDVRLEVPTDLVPHCPKCGRLMEMNLRIDDTFVEDAGWHVAAERYSDFLAHCGIEGESIFGGKIGGKGATDKKVLLLELGIGMNTPGIIKYPFWQYTYNNSHVTYACVNMGEAWAPEEIADRAICVDGDFAETLRDLNR